MSSRGAEEARRLFKAEKRMPTDADRPPPSTFKGPKIKVLPGQLAIGQDVDGDERAEAGEETTAS